MTVKTDKLVALYKTKKSNIKTILNCHCQKDKIILESITNKNKQK